MAKIKPAKHIWFFSYKRSGVHRDHARQTETFATEIEAREFARSKIDEKDLYAGTINPYVPKRTVSSCQIDDWLDEG
jgi:hypothetical protein